MSSPQGSHKSLARLSGVQTRDQSSRDQQARDVLKRLGVSDTCDSEVLEHVIGLIREQTHEHVRTLHNTTTSSMAPPTFRLDYHPCKKFLNKDK